MFRDLLMKIFNILLLLFLIVNIAQSKEDGFKRYNVKSGIVVYKMSGTQEGTETLYWDNYGKREARYTESTINFFGIKKTTKQLVILDGIWSYSVNYDDKTVTKNSVEHLKEIAKGNNLLNTGQEFLEKNGEKQGSEKILNKICDKWYLPDFATTLWIWNSIPLKSKTNMIITITLTATSLKTNIKIPEDKFKYPKDFELINRE